METAEETEGVKPSLPAYSIVVTGAGTEEANGLYVPSGPVSGPVLHLVMRDRPEFTLSRELVRGAYGWVIGKKPDALLVFDVASFG